MHLSGQGAGTVLLGPTSLSTVSRWRQSLLLASAGLCLACGLYFALIIAPQRLAGAAPSVEKGLLQEWVGCRAILHGRDPYQPDVTKQIQDEFRGSAYSSAPPELFRYPYPVFFVLLFLPLAVLPFGLAQKMVLIGGAVLTGLSVSWWLHDSKRSRLVLFAVTLFFFASYPTILALQLRQPSLLIAALLAGVFCCVRRNRLVLAGSLAAMSTCKPQLAIAVLIPLSIWSVTQWPKRKAFLASLSATLAVLLVGSEIAIPGWFSHWLNVLRAYPHYGRANPLLLEILPQHLYVPAAVLLLSAVVAVSAVFCNTDLLFAISFCAVAFQLLFPFQIYNEVLLLPATLWILRNAGAIKTFGQLHELLHGSAWVVLAAGWASAAGLAFANLLFRDAGTGLWQLPLMAAWLYPWPLFLTLAAFAACSMWKRRSVKQGNAQ